MTVHGQRINRHEAGAKLGQSPRLGLASTNEDDVATTDRPQRIEGARNLSLDVQRASEGGRQLWLQGEGQVGHGSGSIRADDYASAHGPGWRDTGVGAARVGASAPA